MADEEYEPSPWAVVRDQVDLYERTGGQEGNLNSTGQPIVIVTTRGVKTGKVRKVPLMRVEHGGEYALIGSQGGAPVDPLWVNNFRADPHGAFLQDGPDRMPVSLREAHGDERSVWWDRAVAAYPTYEEYQQRTTRTIPVFVARRR